MKEIRKEKNDTNEPSLVDVLSLVCRVGVGRVWWITINAKKEGKERQIAAERKKE